MGLCEAVDHQYNGSRRVAPVRNIKLTEFSSEDLKLCSSSLGCGVRIASEEKRTKKFPLAESMMIVA
jgi:hypothetical protein